MKKAVGLLFSLSIDERIGMLFNHPMSDQAGFKHTLQRVSYITSGGWGSVPCFPMHSEKLLWESLAKREFIWNV